MRRLKGTVALIGLTTILAGTLNCAHANTAEWCENEWLEHSGQFVNKERPDYPGLLSYWQQQEAKCAGTVAYEARLAFIHLYLDDQEKARAVLAAAKKKESKYKKLVELVELIADSFALSEPSQLDEARLKEFGKRTLEFAKRYPEFPEGLAFVGGVQTTLGNHAAAIPLLEKANSIADERMSRSGLEANATISYAALGNYSKAHDAADAVLNGNAGFLANPPFMYALIKTQAELGMLEAAKTSAEVLRAKTPAVATDPEFAGLVKYLRAKIRAAGADLRQSRQIDL